MCHDDEPWNCIGSGDVTSACTTRRSHVHLFSQYSDGGIRSQGAIGAIKSLMQVHGHCWWFVLRGHVHVA